MINQTAPDGDKHNAATTTDEGKLAIPLNLPQPKPASKHPEDDQSKPYNGLNPLKRFLQWKRDPKRERAGWTDAAIVLLTCGIVLLAFMQWLEMHEGGKQTDRIIAADERIASAMEGSLTQAKNSFDAANRQAILSQRAWVSFGIRIQNPDPKATTPPEEPLKAGTVIDIRTTIKNTGRTPAINVKGILERTPVDCAKDGTYPYPALRFALQPHENLNPDGELYGDMLLPFTEMDKKRIDSGKVRVYFVGRIEYDDVFGGHHWRNTCAYLLPTGAFAVCENRNDIDYKVN